MRTTGYGAHGLQACKGCSTRRCLSDDIRGQTVVYASAETHRHSQLLHRLRAGSLLALVHRHKPQPLRRDAILNLHISQCRGREGILSCARSPNSCARARSGCRSSWKGVATPVFADLHCACNCERCRVDFAVSDVFRYKATVVGKAWVHECRESHTLILRNGYSGCVRVIYGNGCARQTRRRVTDWVTGELRRG